MTFDPAFKSINPEYNNLLSAPFTGLPVLNSFSISNFISNWSLPAFFDFSNIKFILPEGKSKTNFTFSASNLNGFSTPTYNFTMSSSPSGVRQQYTYQSNTSGNIDNSYLHLSRSAAFQRALSDSNLERLSGGTNWEIAESSFITDIPFAKKGTSAVLDKVGSMIGEKLVITSALGTGEAGNPHQTGGYASHHNAENPKLDIRISGNGQELAQKLRSTGYFSRVSVESDHLDVQIDPDKFKSFEAVA